MNQNNTFIYFVISSLLFLKLDGKPAEQTSPSSQGYSTKYDNFDVKKILSSNRLLQRYVDCLMDRTSCPAEGKFLKDILPDAIGTKCSKCNEAQKKQAAYILQNLLLNHRDMFFELCNKYDPTGEARKQYHIDEPYDEKEIEEEEEEEEAK